MNTCKPIMSLGELAVILCPKAKQEELLTALKEQAIVSSPKQLLIVQKDWPLFPYLKTKDQVLLNLSENKKERLSFQEMLKIDPALLNREPDQLSLFDKIKLQLLHALLAKKDKLIIEEVLDELKVIEAQEILDLLDYLVKNKKIAILLLTHDETIAHSQYVDQIYDER